MSEWCLIEAYKISFSLDISNDESGQWPEKAKMHLSHVALVDFPLQDGAIFGLLINRLVIIIMINKKGLDLITLFRFHCSGKPTIGLVVLNLCKGFVKSPNQSTKE